MTKGFFNLSGQSVWPVDVPIFLLGSGFDVVYALILLEDSEITHIFGKDHYTPANYGPHSFILEHFEPSIPGLNILNVIYIPVFNLHLCLLPEIFTKCSFF